MSRIRKFLFYLVASVSMLGMAGCVYDPYYPPPPSGYVYGAEPGVPYLDYYYYPSANVYFSISTGYYWYLSGTRWVYTRYLPEYIHLHPHDRYKLTAPRDRPYRYHDDHFKRYPPRPDHRPDKRFDHEEREHNRRSYQEYRKQPSTLKRPPPDSRAEPRNERERSEDRRRYEEYREQPSTLKRPPPDSRAEPRNERERSEDRRRYEEYMRQETQQKQTAPDRRGEPRNERERSEDRRRYEENMRQESQQKRSVPEPRAEQRHERERSEERRHEETGRQQSQHKSSTPDDSAEPQSEGEQYEERQNHRQRDNEGRQDQGSMKRAYPR